MSNSHEDDRKRDQYERRRKRNRDRDRAESAAGKDLGELPGVKNLRRRKRCARNLRLFLLTYLGESFGLKFSDDQEKFIREVETRILSGGAKAQAMPRGSGKTTILIGATIWAMAYGHRRFVALIGAEQEAADELADDFRMVWETNDLLAEDFPEIAYPIRALEGVVNRAKAQTINGRQTHLRWSGAKLVMPSVWVDPRDPRAKPRAKPNADGLVPTVASGAVLRSRGLLGRIRGMKSTTPQGDTIRPDLVLVDDFQTDASAKSDTQCATREKTIAGAVLGLAGPGKRIAAFATCTVIRRGDSADRVLNRKLYPRWRGTRCKLVERWPDESANKHWDRYQEIRQEELAEDEEHPKATAYYRKHRKVMDKGAIVAWADRKFDHELSALEHAQNLRHDNPDTFDAEYQNEPKDEAQSATDLAVLNSDGYCLAQASTRRGEVPIDAQWVTVGVDVQKTVLYWSVVAVDDQFGGTVIDYGAWPKQPASYWKLDEVERTLQAATGKANEAAAIQAGLAGLTKYLSELEFTREDGLTMRIDRGLVDAGYETQAIYRWARGTSAPYLPAMGWGVTAKQASWDTLRKKRGERIGHFWKIPSPAKTAAVKRVDIDVNTWKTTLQKRFALPDGEPGRWTLYKRPPQMHRMIADHLSSEFAVKTSGRGRELYEWSLRPGAENHLLDATLYAAVAANLAGARLPEETVRRKTKPPKSASESTGGGRAAKPAKKSKMSMAEMRAAKRRAA